MTASDPKRGEAGGEESPADAPLREEDVTRMDRLDDRVSEAEGLPDGEPDSEHD